MAEGFTGGRSRWNDDQFLEDIHWIVEGLGNVRGEVLTVQGSHGGRMWNRFRGLRCSRSRRDEMIGSGSNNRIEDDQQGRHEAF